MSRRKTPGLTITELAVLRQVRLCREVSGVPPTVREICCEFGWTSPNAAWCILSKLRAKGCVSWIDGKSRTIQLTRKGRLLASTNSKAKP